MGVTSTNRQVLRPELVNGLEVELHITTTVDIPIHMVYTLR